MLGLARNATYERLENGAAFDVSSLTLANRSDDNVNMAGVEALIAPGRARKLRQIGEADRERSELLAHVETGEVDKATAADQFGVTRARVNQLLRIRRNGDT